METMTISVRPGGRMLAIYRDDLCGLLDQCDDVKITRASHVEPTPSGNWIADMTPAVKRFNIQCDNPILGPFKLRSEALDAETKFLNEKLFGSKNHS